MAYRKMNSASSRLRRLAARSLTFAAGLAVGSWHLGCIGCYDLEWTREEDFDEQVPENYQCIPEASPCPDLYVSEDCDLVVPYDPAVGACILGSLRTAEPATHVVEIGCRGGGFVKSTTIQVFDDGNVLWDYRDVFDLNYSMRETWRVLPGPEYFDGCDAETLDGLRECMEGLLDQPCAGGSPPCSKS